MTGRQHSIVKHRENYFYVPLEDDYLLMYTLLAERLDPIKIEQGKRPSGSSDCKAMIAAIIEAWMNSKRATATCEDDLYVYFTHDQIVQELRGRYKRTMIIQCLQEMETEGEYTDPNTGEVYTGTIKKRPHKQHISKYVLNLPVVQALLNDLPAQSPFDKSLNITLGRPKKYRSKTDGINEEKNSSEKYRINLNGINEKPSENGRNNEEIPSKNGLPFYTQNSNTTQYSKDTEGERVTSSVSSNAHVSDDNAPTPSSSSQEVTPPESEETKQPSEQSSEQAVSYSQSEQNNEAPAEPPNENKGKGGKGEKITTAQINHVYNVLEQLFRTAYNSPEYCIPRTRTTTDYIKSLIKAKATPALVQKVFKKLWDQEWWREPGHLTIKAFVNQYTALAPSLMAASQNNGSTPPKNESDNGVLGVSGLPRVRSNGDQPVVSYVPNSVRGQHRRLLGRRAN